MVNTVTKQTLIDGQRNLVLQVYIAGDGSGEETGTIIVDVSTFAGNPATVRVNRIQADLSGFAAALLWDATTDVPFLDLIDGRSAQSFRKIGGLINNSSTGKTGDILITTLGLGTGDKGTITIEMVKK